MSTLTYALTTKAKVKEYLGIDTAVTTNDALIETMINQVTDFIEGYCGGRRFKSTSYTEDYDTKSTKRKIFLNQLPVSALTSVKYRGGTPSTPVYTDYSADGYLLYSDEGYIEFFSYLFDMPKGLRIVYTAGYLIDFANELTSTHTLPFDLTGVATDLVTSKFNTKDSAGIQQMSTEGQAVTFSSKSLTSEQKEILGRYKTVRMSI